jgi:uncharacterized protein involved in exopolysaccharide biosynthesis
MPDETGGLIERAAALVPLPGLIRPATRLGDQHRQPHKPGPRADHGSAQIGPGPLGTAAPFDAGIQPMLVPKVERGKRGLWWLLRALSLHKFALALTTLLVFVGVTVAIFSLTPRYAAVAAVAIGNRTPNAATRIGADGGNPAQVRLDATAVRMQADYLRSRPVAETAMGSLHLWDRPEFNPSVRPHDVLFKAMSAWIEPAIALAQGWRNWLSGSTAKEDGAAASDDAKRNQALEAFLSRLSVAAEPNSRIITIRFEDPDPKLAAATANAVADQYISREIAAASAAAQRVTEGLEQAVAALRQRVAKSDQAYEQYLATSQRIEEATKELTSAEAARQVIEARLTALRRVTDGKPTADAMGEVSESRELQKLREQAAALQGRLAQLSATLGEAHPRIQQLKEAISRVHGEMHAEATKELVPLKAELNVARAKEASLRQSLGVSAAELAQLSPGQAKLDALKVEAESNRAVLNTFLTRLHEANASAKLSQRANAEIVAHASVPTSPASPKVKPLLVLAAVGATLAGLGVAIALEQAAPRRQARPQPPASGGARRRRSRAHDGRPA